MAYILGFFAADGYITVNKRGGQFWCVDIKDRELLEIIKKKIESEHKISIRERNRGQSRTYRLQVGSIEMCEDLRRLGFSERKTKNLAIPNIPRSYFSHFVRGYFDGDGNIWMGEIHKDKNRKTRHTVLKLYFTSCSLEFLKELHSRLRLLGLLGGCIYTSKKRSFSRLQYSTTNTFKLYDLMYNSRTKAYFGLFLKRKKEVFERYIKFAAVAHR